MLRAHAAAYAEARLVEDAAEAAGAEAEAAGAAAAAARARTAREVLGLPLLVAAQVRGARASPSPPRTPHEEKEPGGGRAEE